ncbi:sporulation protein YunB [Desulforamulus ruminis]|uniref:Sporulation protein YunB n=1 Tax=Desulforamulus ruminis (strain ATCC 23193 / DSM 2154 / NCIMB 8452 / DL) TaxID=696281 RepID=F6DN78_DESRL|nr:sporulation protein YunB [Desulforamulus ruminis]AEG60667.1 sporulation protein YunB [Desulforamulus ruminis DSM 2154]
MFRKTRGLSKKYVVLMISLVVVGLLVGFFIFTDRVLQPSIFTIARVKAIHLATEILNETVRDRMAKQPVHYQDLIHIHKDSSGKIVMIQADTVKINQLSTDMTLKVQEALRKIDNQSINIPLGQLLGFQLLAALGPELNVRLIPVGIVRVDIIDKFEGAGINQTRHLIWMDLTSEFQIAVPLHKEVFKVSVKVPLAESIIVGDVPPALISMPGGVVGQ